MRRNLMGMVVMLPPVFFMAIGLIDIHRQRVEMAVENYAIATALSVVIAWVGRVRIARVLVRIEDRWQEINRRLP